MRPLDALSKACETRPGDPVDAVDGVVPAYVASPGSLDEAREAMRLAAEHELSVVPRGAGTKLDWGAPPRACDLVVDTTRLDRVLEHAAGDLVVRAQAGLPLRRLQEELAPHGQQLALDEPVPGSTVGGVLATATSGPQRLLYGAARDLLIGVTVVRADGTVARSGGKVVKNVAGYDLGKLYTGSYGTLGLIVEAAFRLHPVPPARSFATCEVPDPAGAYERVRAVLGSQLVPSAVEVDRAVPGGPITVAVLLEGIAPGVEARSRQVLRLLGEGARASETAPPWWATYPASPDGVLVKLTAEISALDGVLGAIDEAGAETGLAPSVRGSAGMGVLYVGLPADAEPSAVSAFLTGLREVVARRSGAAMVLHAPREIRTQADAVWGPVRGLSAMHRVKDQFDPEHRLSPGRFVGGI